MKTQPIGVVPTLELVWWKGQARCWFGEIADAFGRWPARQPPPYAMQATVENSATVTLSMHGETSYLEGQLCPVVYGSVVDGSGAERLCFQAILLNYSWALMRSAILDQAEPGAHLHSVN